VVPADVELASKEVEEWVVLGHAEFHADLLGYHGGNQIHDDAGASDHSKLDELA
jgi:hypothetical protein